MLSDCNKGAAEMKNSRGTSEARDINPPDLYGVVVASAGKAQLTWVEGDGADSVEMTGE